MIWIIQNNLYTEQQDFSVVRDTLEKFSIPYYDVSIQNGRLIPEINIDTSKKVMILGGYSLMRYSMNNNLTPGCFTKNMNIESWIKNYKENMLNYDSKILNLGDVEESKEFFARPVLDSKEFTGRTFHTQEDYNLFMKDLLDNSKICTEDTKVMISSIKNILSETRFFIINGKIVSGSVYKINGRMQTSQILDDNKIRFCEKMISTYQPDKAFVMDVALTEHGYKIVELNCINCSGFYESNIQKIIMELNFMFQ